jgi:hypothetical protein
MENLKLLSEEVKSKGTVQANNQANNQANSQTDSQAGAEGITETIVICNTESNLADTSNEVITLEELTSALRIKIGKKNGAKEENVRKLAEYILNFFGYSDTIIDNILNTDDRDVFYTLEEEGILSTEREEMYILKGKVWRIHYWMLKKKEIKRLPQAANASKELNNDEYANVYGSLSDDIWKRN